MKLLQSTFILCFSILLSTGIYAQKSGMIFYQETMSMEIEMDGLPEGIDLSGMMPSSRTVNKQLVFNQKETSYLDSKEAVENTEITSDDGSIQFVIMESDIESNYYTNYKNKSCLDQRGFMGKQFVITKPLEKIKWKITNEKIKYLDYECMKATMTDQEGKEVVAWFAPALPVKAGPASYGQLPGAILMLSKGDKELEIKAIKVELKDAVEVKTPSEGEKLTEEEFEKVVEDKLNEMQKEFGGNSIMIRG